MTWLTTYQTLPLRISPTIFHSGFFSIEWYSLMYLAAFLVVWTLLVFRLKKKEDISIFGQTALKVNLITDFLIYAILGVLLGGRLGYVLFYNLPYYLAHPVEIISPYNFQNGLWTGIYGMSYHGGLLGVFLSSWLFSKKNKLNFLKWADFIVPAIPAGYFFGRIGNFLNGELYGRVTQRWWGMYFADGSLWPILRHPSQLYEAFFEGLILFLILWTIRNKTNFPGFLLVVYLFGYAIFRFFLEFFREPDEQLGLFWNYLTLGQIFSLIMVLSSSVVLWLFRKRKKLV